MLKFSASAQSLNIKLDLAFNNVKPKDWYFVFDLVRFRTGLGHWVLNILLPDNVGLPHVLDLAV